MDKLHTEAELNEVLGIPDGSTIEDATINLLSAQPSVSNLGDELLRQNEEAMAAALAADTDAVAGAGDADTDAVA